MKAIWKGETDDFALINGKTYDVLNEAWDGTMFNVIDETGEAFLYPKEDFEIVADILLRKYMELTITVDLKNLTGEVLPLDRPAFAAPTENGNAASLRYFNGFRRMCLADGEHTNKDMAVCAALLFEMQNTGNVPPEYAELAPRFAPMVKVCRARDVSESRDYVFFAYDVMRELAKCENAAYVHLSADDSGVLACASQDDDLSAVAAVNASDKEHTAVFSLSGLPGRQTNIDYYAADEYEQFSLMCNTDMTNLVSSCFSWQATYNIRNWQLPPPSLIFLRHRKSIGTGAYKTHGTISNMEVTPSMAAIRHTHSVHHYGICCTWATASEP